MVCMISCSIAMVTFHELLRSVDDPIDHQLYDRSHAGNDPDKFLANTADHCQFHSFV